MCTHDFLPDPETMSESPNRLSAEVAVRFSHPHGKRNIVHDTRKAQNAASNRRAAADARQWEQGHRLPHDTGLANLILDKCSLYGLSAS
jgi:hypothetical protein